MHLRRLSNEKNMRCDGVLSGNLSTSQRKTRVDLLLLGVRAVRETKGIASPVPVQITGRDNTKVLWLSKLSYLRADWISTSDGKKCRKKRWTAEEKIVISTPSSSYSSKWLPCMDIKNKSNYSEYKNERIKKPSHLKMRLIISFFFFFHLSCSILYIFFIHNLNIYF